MRKAGYYWVLIKKDSIPEMASYDSHTKIFQLFENKDIYYEPEIYKIYDRLFPPIESEIKNFTAGTILELEMPEPSIWNFDSSILKDRDKIEMMEIVLDAIEKKLKSKNNESNESHIQYNED